MNSVNFINFTMGGSRFSYQFNVQLKIDTSILNPEKTEIAENKKSHKSQQV